MIKIFALLVISVLFASFNCVLLHKAAIKKTTEVYLFNLVGSVVWVVMLLLLNGKNVPSLLLIGIF